MRTPTHATLATFRMDLTREEDQRVGLEQMIVQSVSSSPGFVSGTWTLDRDAAESFVLLTFDSLDAAESMRESVVGNAENQRAVGIDLLRVRVLEVSAAAGSVDLAGA